MTLTCIHCGDYELSAEEEFDARIRLRSHERTVGIQCYRCNEEARIVGDRPGRLIRPQSPEKVSV